MTEFIARNHGHSCFEIIIKTTDEGHYEAAQSFARQLIDNGVATTEDTNVLINADRIRAMSDEELAKLIYGVDSLGWCKSLPECVKQTSLIPEEKCVGCALAWLQQPAED